MEIHLKELSKYNKSFFVFVLVSKSNLYLNLNFSPERRSPAAVRPILMEIPGIRNAEAVARLRSSTDRYQQTQF